MYAVRTIGAIGELVLPALPPGFLGVDPRTGEPSPDDARVRDAIIALAPNATDTQAKFFLDFADATSYGGRQKLVRYGVGVACGLALGVIGAALLGKRK